MVYSVVGPRGGNNVDAELIMKISSAEQLRQKLQGGFSQTTQNVGGVYPVPQNLDLIINSS
jgi:hypothetical protein